MKLPLLAAVALLLMTTAAARAGEQWQARAADSELTFAAWYEGEELAGRFSRFDVRVAATEDAGPQSLQVEVQVGSADMNDDEINAELLEPDWFNANAFPVAVYESAQIEAREGSYLASGKLVIKGIEQPLELAFDWRREDELAVLEGSATLSRLAWQVGGGEWAGDASLADRVAVRFRIVLARAP